MASWKYLLLCWLGLLLLSLLTVELGAAGATPLLAAGCYWWRWARPG